MKELDKRFMRLALKEALAARKKGEVPVGAVIVREGIVISRGHNLKESGNDPTAHAEVIAVKKASKKLKNWRIGRSTLYVTLEPCLMCMGLLIQARIERLVFGSSDPKAGACGSLYDVSNDPRLNHRIRVTTGVMEKETGELLKGFFGELRRRRKNDR